MKTNRLVSLDIFRGITMIMMTIVNNPGDWGHIYSPLEHAEWHGCTPTDLVFPFFIFAMGMAIPYAISQTETFSKNQFLKIATRSISIISLGLLLNFFSKIHVGNMEGIPLMILRVGIMTGLAKIIFSSNALPKNRNYILILFVSMLLLACSGFPYFEFVRIPGVLQRIGLVYFIVCLLYFNTTQTQQIIIGISILIFYYFLMTFMPASIGGGFFDKGHNVAAFIDAKLLTNHLWAVSKTWDPEGILSTLPAIVTGLIGLMTGKFLKQNSNNAASKILGMAMVLLILGQVWNVLFPINKALWSSSYVLWAGGWAMVLIAMLYYFYDMNKSTVLLSFFQMWGVNSLIVFFGSGILPRAAGMIKFHVVSNGISTEKSLGEIFYQKLVVPIFENPFQASFSMALLHVLFWSVILYYLKQKNIIFKV